MIGSNLLIDLEVLFLWFDFIDYGIFNFVDVSVEFIMQFDLVVVRYLLDFMFIFLNYF